MLNYDDEEENTAEFVVYGLIFALIFMVLPVIQGVTKRLQQDIRACEKQNDVQRWYLATQTVADSFQRHGVIVRAKSMKNLCNGSSNFSSIAFHIFHLGDVLLEFCCV